MRDFTRLRHVGPELAQRLIDHGYVTFADLSIIEPRLLAQLGNLTTATVEAIIVQSEIQFSQTATGDE